MNATVQPGRVLFAAAWIALGVTRLVNGDFALVRRTDTARDGEIVVALVRDEEATLPEVFRAPLDATTWGGIGEIGTMLAGAWCLFAASAEPRHAESIAGASGIRAARWLLMFTLAMLGVDRSCPAPAASPHVSGFCSVSARGLRRRWKR